MKTLLDMLDLTISENYDNKIDAVNDLKDIIEELKSDTPEEVKHSLQSWSKNKLQNLQQDLIENGRCPDCGEELENEVETETGYLDGRPAYQVNEVVGRYCPECGWEE